MSSDRPRGKIDAADFGAGVRREICDRQSMTGSSQRTARILAPIWRLVLKPTARTIALSVKGAVSANPVTGLVLPEFRP